jgi:hypothetical protein
MAFWSDSNLREPLRQNRWYITFPGNDYLQQYVYALKECSKPQYKIETTSHVLLNHTFNFPKNLIWQPISVKMVSARTGNKADGKSFDLKSLSHGILSALSKSYIIPEHVQNVQISKVNLTDSSIQIIQVDANGIIVETWILKNSMINSVNFGNLSYNNEDFVEVTFEIIYDYAILESIDGKVNDSLGQEYEEGINIAQSLKSGGTTLTVGSPFYPGPMPDNFPE